MTQTDPHDIYAPPQAPLAEPVASAEVPPFYVVSVAKLGLLLFATFGLYSLYWFWRHWVLYRWNRKRFDIWPVPRAVFAIFFVHGLNNAIDQTLRRNGSTYTWSAANWATLFVVFVAVSWVYQWFPESGLPPWLGMIVSVVSLSGQFIAMAHAQRAANMACNDPEADANRHLTVANWAWLVLGTVVWLLTLIGLLLVTPIEVQLPAP